MALSTLNIVEQSHKLLDNVGWQLLRELQADARIPFSELGRRVGLSSPAVAERVRRMEEAGIITGYRAVVDPAKVGLPIKVFIRVSTSGSGTCLRTMEYLTALPEVLECHHVTGSDSLVLKAVVSSVTHLEEMLNHISAYGQPNTSIVLSSPIDGRPIDSILWSESENGRVE